MLLRIAVLLLCCLWSFAAAAAPSAPDPCQLLPADAAQSQDVGQRIAAAACAEHRAWYRSFINLDGRIGPVAVREGERSQLADGQPAWQRVIEYWRGSGLLWQAGAGDCAYAGTPLPSCRMFAIDTPWSAAFVSWVMRRANVPGFQPAASHLQYVRRAYREPFNSPYRVASPLASPARPGDMLCFVRGAARVFGFGELATLLSNGEPGLGMHCDIVVGATIASDGTRVAHLVGGNVLDSVVMRRLPLTPGDRFRDLPLRQAADPDCTPESDYACDLNRQDWAVLLQLRPAEDLVTLAPPPPVAVPVQPVPGRQQVPPSTPSTGRPDAAAGEAVQEPAPARCCNHCDPEVGLPRCPVRPANP
jgi:hypothetical protein